MTQGNIATETSEEKAVLKADVVVEAIPEKMEFKHKLFKTIDVAAPANTIFVSNTSSLSIGASLCSAVCCCVLIPCWWLSPSKGSCE